MQAEGNIEQLSSVSPVDLQDTQPPKMPDGATKHSSSAYPAGPQGHSHRRPEMPKSGGKGISFIRPVDLDDPERLADLVSQKIIFSQSPFDHPDEKNNGKSGHPPFWLELSGDLAWSAAFASLTNNRTISGRGDITNYAVFFALMWQLWASQAAYEVKFYTDDWCHRIFFVLQLLTYGALSSFTADFDVFWWLRDYSYEVFTGNVSNLTAVAMVSQATRAKEVSLMGVSVIIFANRILLLLLYIRVEIYRYKCQERKCENGTHCKYCWHCRHCEHLNQPTVSKCHCSDQGSGCKDCDCTDQSKGCENCHCNKNVHRHEISGSMGQSTGCENCGQNNNDVQRRESCNCIDDKKYCKRCWKCYAIPVSIAISAFIFLGCFLMLRFRALTRTTSITLFILWGTAMLIEGLGHGFSGKIDENLTNRGRIADRLSNLTVIVMGEGLNSICAVSKTTVNAVGVGFKMIAILGCLGVTLFCIWLCYFDGYHTRLSKRGHVRPLWFILHFPFHLFLILVLEGLKSMLLQSNLVISTKYLRKIFPSGGINQNANTKKVVKVLDKLGISWSQFQVDSALAALKGGDDQKIWYQRFVLFLMYRQFQKYQEIDEETTFRFENYQKNNEEVLSDLAVIGTSGRWGPIFQGIISRLEKPLFSATTYLVPTAGAVLVLIGILNFVQKWPRDRYDWGTILNKVLGGSVLIVLVSIHIQKNAVRDLGATVWRLPTLALVLGAVTAIDVVLLRILLPSMKGRDMKPEPRRCCTNTGTQAEIASDSDSKDFHRLGLADSPVPLAKSDESLNGSIVGAVLCRPLHIGLRPAHAVEASLELDSV